MTLYCGEHRAYVHARGGHRRIAQLHPLTLVRWNRERDAISNCEIVVPTEQCCEQLADLRTILNEIHIERRGEPVWEGPITRLEYERDQVRIFSEDVLWQTTRSVVNPAMKQVVHEKDLVLDAVDILLQQAYSRQGDPWHMLPGHLKPIRSPNEPNHNRSVNNWQSYAWQEIDKFAEDYGVDYTVVNRDVYYWDVHWAWKILPPLEEDWISESPRIVEYGNSMFTRAVVTKGAGYAGVDDVGLPFTGPESYGYVDKLVNNAEEGDTSAKPKPTTLLHWQERALRLLNHTCPAPVGIVVPENATLLPGAGWNLEDLIPGAWFRVNLTRLCRDVSQWNRLQRVTVEEQPPGGETITFSAVTAPQEMHIPPL